MTGVADVSLRSSGGMPLQVAGFDLVDVSARGLEGVRYELVDFEDGLLHCFAAAAEAAGGWRLVSGDGSPLSLDTARD